MQECIMNKPDFQLYQLDLTATSVFNKVTLEEGMRESEREDINYMFIPRSAPFYIDSVEMYRIDGSKMIFGEDYDFYGILSELTAYTTKPVGLYIRILKQEIKRWKVTYQVVGNFNKITQEILDMLRVLQDDDRLIDYDNIDNKPLWFVPELHSHDWTYEVFGFTDLAHELLRVGDLAAETAGKNIQNRIDSFITRLDSYIELYKTNLTALIDSHHAGKVDNHGVNKTHIGLGLVDNFSTATLEETLEGLRRDLHIVPAYAAKAAELAAGRNERLFPSGSLPILRYGSDSFIPPKIDGSFEGMGGSIWRPGACVESTGELLLLQRRYNGKVKGLYFLRCTRWDTDRPIWEFTGYRYQHPTATAAGANLTAIIAGSNENIMVVGDEDKNIWFWVECNGTFNPAKHTLNRITGDFLTWSYLWGKAQVLADKNYKELNIIAMAVPEAVVRAIRPSFPDQGPGDQSINGWMFFLNQNMDGNYISPNVDFYITHGNMGNFKDGVFTPEPNIIVQGGITEAIFTPTVPLGSMWHYHTPFVAMSKDPAIGRWSVYFEHKIYYVTGDLGGNYSGTHVWRGTMWVTPGSPKPLIAFERGVNEKSYSLNPSAPQSSPDWQMFSKYKTASMDYSYLPYAGSVIFNDNFRLLVRSSNASTIPLSFILDQCNEYNNPKELSGTQERTGWKPYYSYNFEEKNPIGLSAGFMNQFLMVGNIDDPSTSVLLARQNVLDPAEIALKGHTKWIARSVTFLKSDYHGRWDNVGTMTLNGKAVSYYPFQNNTYELNIGPAILLGTHVKPDDGVNRKSTWRDFIGADGYSFFLGKVPASANLYTPGDGLLIHRNKTRIVGKTIEIVPEVVCKVDTVIKSTVPGLIKTLFNKTITVDTNWALCPVWDLNGSPYYFLIISYLEDAGSTMNAFSTVAPVDIIPTGTPVVKDGYNYYSNATITFKKPFTPPGIHLTNVRKVSNLMGQGGGATQHSAISVGLEAPARKENITYSIRSLHRYNQVGDTRMIDLMLEVLPDFTINRRTLLGQTSIAVESAVVITPGHGLSKVGDGTSYMEGAGNVSYGYTDPSDNSWYTSILAGATKPTPFVGMSNLLVSTYTIYFKDIKNVIIGGKYYDMPSTFIDIRNQDPNPANKKFYVYLKFAGGSPYYEVTQTVYPETAVVSMLAEVQCGPSQIDSITPYNRFSMDGAIISTKRQGSAIRAATGGSFETGYTGWFNPTDFVPE
jgi:hypothetical protein